MIRLLGIGLAVAVAAAIALWLANQPGSVTIVADGYEVRTGLGIAVLLLILAAAILSMAVRLLLFLARAPRRVGRAFRRRTRQAPLEGAGSPIPPNPSGAGASTSENHAL